MALQYFDNKRSNFYKSIKGKWFLIIRTIFTKTLTTFQDSIISFACSSTELPIFSCRDCDHFYFFLTVACSNGIVLVAEQHLNKWQGIFLIKASVKGESFEKQRCEHGISNHLLVLLRDF